MQPKKILIVDDNDAIRDLLRSMLDLEADLEVVGEAGDGEQGIRLAEQLQPDGILMDFMMPGMNGADATRAIKERYPHIQIIGYTSPDDDPRLADMEAAGAYARFTKLEVNEVIPALRRAIAARGGSEQS